VRIAVVAVVAFQSEISCRPLRPLRFKVFAACPGVAEGEAGFNPQSEIRNLLPGLRLLGLQDLPEGLGAGGAVNAPANALGGPTAWRGCLLKTAKPAAHLPYRGCHGLSAIRVRGVGTRFGKQTVAPRLGTGFAGRQDRAASHHPGRRRFP